MRPARVLLLCCADRLAAAILFLCGRKDVKLFRPNRDGCASFAKHLKQACTDGVTVMAHRVEWGEGKEEGKAFWGGELPCQI